MSQARPRIEGQASALTWVGFVFGVVTLAGLVFVAPGLPWLLMHDPRPPDRTQGAVYYSPDGRHQVTVVRVSGGGAAGFVYDELWLEGDDVAQEVLLVDGLWDPELRWESPSRLRIFAAARDRALHQSGSVEILYGKPR